MTRLLPLLISASLLAAAGIAHAKLYKWVDDQGNVHYSDRVPPQHANREREVKSEKSGTTVEKVEAPPTKEELAEQERLRQEEAARKEAARKQAEKDRILLLTFTSVEEMERARDDRLRAIESRINLTQSRIEKLEAQIEKEKQRAAQLERNGRSPDEAHQRIQALERQIADNRGYIKGKRAEQAEIREKFDSDIARFKELKARD